MLGMYIQLRPLYLNIFRSEPYQTSIINIMVRLGVPCHVMRSLLILVASI